MTTTKVTPATLAAVLAAARGGEDIALEAGDYGALNPRRRVFAEPVTIRSADPARPARFRSLNVQECAGLVFKDLAVSLAPDEATKINTPVVYFYKSSRCRFVGGEVSAGLAVAGVPIDAEKLDASQSVIGMPTALGVYIAGGEDITIEGVNIHHVYRGINANGLRITLKGNQVHHTRRSTIMAGGSDLLIEENRLHSVKPWRYGDTARGGDHGDFINVWNGGLTPLTNITIRNNRLETGDGFPMMGGWIQGKAGGVVGYEYSGNTIIGGDHQGLLVTDVKDGKIFGNVMVQDVPGAKDIGIILRTGVENVAVFDNLVGSVADAAKGGTGNKIEDNTTLQASDPAKAGYVPADVVTMLRAATDAASMRAVLAPAEDPPVEPPVIPPARDELRELIARRTVVKQEPLKTKGRVSIDFKTPGEADAFLAAVLAILPKVG